MVARLPSLRAETADARSFSNRRGLCARRRGPFDNTHGLSNGDTGVVVSHDGQTRVGFLSLTATNRSSSRHRDCRGVRALSRRRCTARRVRIRRGGVRPGPRSAGLHSRVALSGSYRGHAHRPAPGAGGHLSGDGPWRPWIARVPTARSAGLANPIDRGPALSRRARSRTSV